MVAYSRRHHLHVFFIGFSGGIYSFLLAVVPAVCCVAGAPELKWNSKWVVGFGRQKKMSKLYIGNLAAEANEAALRQLLQESGVGNVSSVLVKRGGYAFIDCPEQSTVDRAIEKLNGKFSNYLIFLYSEFFVSLTHSF